MTGNAKRTPPWYVQLEDGVRALGEAASHYQSAYQAARAMARLTAVSRVQIHEGRVTGQPHAEARGWEAKPRSTEPHSKAVFAVSQIHDKHADELHRLYEEAALLYASGAASAIRLVQAGETPARPVLPLDKDRRMVPGPLEIEGVAYSRAEKLTAAYEALADLLDARRYGDRLCEQDYLADHEAGWMHDAWAKAEGIADAAYAYGLLAEGAVRFVLLAARNAPQATDQSQPPTAPATEEQTNG